MHRREAPPCGRISPIAGVPTYLHQTGSFTVVAIVVSGVPTSFDVAPLTLTGAF